MGGETRQKKTINGSMGETQDKNGIKPPTENMELIQKVKYPKAVFFILSNEFCERFSYYGMRAILALYLTYLGFTEDQSTMIYHSFVILCYFTPIIGGIVADSYLGKYKTILYVSLYYAVGNIVLSTASVKSLNINHVVASLIGLFLIGSGTGGIKPCVSAFGGDQFVLPQQERQLAAFFSVFYFSINAGSVLSSFFTPMMREKVACFGDDVCYPLAFGIPALLMCLSVVIFIGGRSLYKINPPSKNNVAVEVFKCCGHAMARKMKGKGEKKAHWLDYADDKYSFRLIEDTKLVLKIVSVLCPTVVFWALFEQQGSRWTFQAKQLDGDLGFYILQPDQMQTVNAVLCITFIPLFESVLYPLLSKLKLVRTPLQKMTGGMLLAAVAFVVSGVLQTKIEEGEPILPSENLAQLQIYNTFNCPITINSPDITKTVNNYDTVLFNIPSSIKNYSVDAKFGPGCSEKDKKFNITIENNKLYTYMFLKDENVILKQIGTSDGMEIARAKDASPKIRVLYGGIGRVDVILKNYLSEKDFSFSDHKSEIQEMKSNLNLTVMVNGKTSNETVHVKSGGVYSILLTDLANVKFSLMTITEPNTISMLWQLPQYVIITAAEIMFSITGLQFCFTQAPLSMKSVMSSLWLMTSALGSLIILIVAGAKIFDKQSSEFFLFALLMSVVMGIFIYLAKSYTYVEISSKEETKTEDSKI